MAVEWKRLAYSDDFEAQLSYPLAHDDDHVKATTYFPDAQNRYAPWKATDPSKQLTGSYTDRSWVSASLGHINQRFHIDLATARYLHGLYYENYHNTGAGTNVGIKTITIWGSNESSAFNDIDYAHDTNWTQIGGTHICAEHVALDQADPQFITEFNSTVAYRYYALKIANNWGHGSLMGVRRLVFITSFNVCELQHAALTIDGTSPLSLSGQAISLKNDSAAAITEADTGTLDNSTTKIPTNKTVYDAILTHQQVLARSLMG